MKEFALPLLLLLASVARGQYYSPCPGGVCQPQYSRPVQYEQPRQAQHANVVSVNNQAHCQIKVGEGRGVFGVGSGTLIARSERGGLVLTCAHLFDESTSNIVVSFPNGERFTGYITERDRANDVALLVIHRPNIEPIPPAENDPSGQLTACGFGPNGQFRAVRGTIGRQVTPVGATYPSLTMSAPVRPGDSGGAVLDSNGQVTGVVWGTRDGVTYCCYGQPVRNLIRRVMGRPPATYVSQPVRPQPVYQPPRQEINPRPPLEPNPPQPLPPVNPLPPPLEPTPADPEVLEQLKQDINVSVDGKLEAHKQEISLLVNNNACNCDHTQRDKDINLALTAIQEVNQRLEQIQLQPGPKGERGEMGPAGPPGEPGPPGTAANLDYDVIAAEVAKRLQPLNLKIDDPRGGAYSTDYKQWHVRTVDQPPQYVKLPFQPLKPAQ